jgi:hypothetical protein
LSAAYAGRFEYFEVGQGACFGNIFEHVIEGDQAVARVGDGAAGGDDFD